jgi:uncharacterized membrane protein
LTFEISPRDALIVLPFLILPILTYLGNILNAGNNNSLLLLVIIFVALLTFVTCLPGNLVPEKFYPLAIAAISFCLIFHVLWMSPHLIGWDVHVESFLSELVKSSGHYLNYPHRYNSALSVTVLPAMVQSLLAVDDTSVFKTIYPLVFSLVPVILFMSYKYVVDSKRAFLSAILFMSYASYYSDVTFIGKQMIGEAILAPMILLTFNSKLQAKAYSRPLTMLILIVGLVISSYTISIFYISFIFLSLLALAALKKRSAVSFVFVTLSVLLAGGWYLYTASGTTFDKLAAFGYEIFQSIFSDLFNPQARGPMVLKAVGVGVRPGLVNSVDLFVHYAIVGFIVLGVVTQWRQRKTVNGEFLSYMCMALSLLILSVVVPYVSTNIGINRIFHMALIFVSPACVLGGESFFKTTFQALSRLSPSSWHSIFPRKGSLTFVSSIIILFLLFNTGLINEISGAPPISLSLGFNRLKESNDQLDVTFLYSAYITEQDFASERWLSTNVALEQTVCADSTYRLNVLLAYLGIAPKPINLDNAGVPLYPGSQASCTYVYLGYMNVVKGLGTAGPWVPPYRMSQVTYLVNARNRIYSNGGSDILAQS